MTGAAAWIAGLLSGLIGAMGLGGGGVLILYLVLFAEVAQVQAQGINLLFFLPCGAVALAIHAFRGRVRWRVVLPCVVGGAVGVAIGSWLLSGIDARWLGKAFGAGLAVLGVKELFFTKKEN